MFTLNRAIDFESLDELEQFIKDKAFPYEYRTNKHRIFYHIDNCQWYLGLFDTIGLYSSEIDYFKLACRLYLDTDDVSKLGTGEFLVHLFDSSINQNEMISLW